MSKLNETEEMICKRIDGMHDEIVEFLRELIRIRSEVPPGNYNEIIKYFSGKTKEYGLETSIIEKPNSGKPNARRPSSEQSLFYDKYKNKFFKPLRSPEIQ